MNAARRILTALTVVAALGATASIASATPTAGTRSAFDGKLADIGIRYVLGVHNKLGSCATEIGCLNAMSANMAIYKRFVNRVSASMPKHSAPQVRECDVPMQAMFKANKTLRAAQDHFVAVETNSALNAVYNASVRVSDRMRTASIIC